MNARRTGLINLLYYLYKGNRLLVHIIHMSIQISNVYKTVTGRFEHFRGLRVGHTWARESKINRGF